MSQVEYNLPDDFPFLPIRQAYRLPDGAYRHYRTPEGLARLRHSLELMRAWTEASCTPAEWRAFHRSPPGELDHAIAPIPDAWPDKMRLLLAIRWHIDTALRDIEAGKIEDAAAIHVRALEAIKTLRQRIQDNPPPSPQGSRQRYFNTLEQWRAIMVPLIRELDRPGDPVTQERVAPYLRDYLPRRSAKNMQCTTDAIKKLIYRQGLRFHYPWEDLVREARS